MEFVATLLQNLAEKQDLKKCEQVCFMFCISGTVGIRCFAGVATVHSGTCVRSSCLPGSLEYQGNTIAWVGEHADGGEVVKDCNHGFFGELTLRCVWTQMAVIAGSCEPHSCEGPYTEYMPPSTSSISVPVCFLSLSKCCHHFRKNNYHSCQVKGPP